MATANELVKQKLEQYCNGKNWKKNKEKNADYANAVEKITVEDIYYGLQPKIISGFIKGNATAEGERTINENNYLRTTNINFTTEEKTFLRGCDYELENKIKQYGLINSYSLCNDCEKFAKKFAKDLCSNELWKYNFTIKWNSFRLNNWNIVYTTNEIKISAWPIYAYIKYENKRRPEKIGYYIEKNNQVFIDLNINVPMDPKKKKAIVKKITIYVVIIIIIIVILKIAGF